MEDDQGNDRPDDSAPETDGQYTKAPEMPSKTSPTVGGPGGNKWLTALWVIVGLIVAAGVLYGVYYWQHQKVENDTTKLSSLNSQVSSLQSQVKSLNNELSKDSASTNSETTITISQMGVQFMVPSSLAELTYHYSTTSPSNNSAVSGETFADFSTTKLASDDTACTADASSDTAQGESLGTLVKGTGTGTNGEDFTVVKQSS